MHLITIFGEAQRRGFYRCLPVKENILKIIPNGIDIERFNPTSVDVTTVRNSLNLKSNDLVVGIVGRVMENKGQWMLVRIAKRLADEFPNLRILFVGSNSKGREDKYFTDLLKEVKELGLDDRIVFTGFRIDIPECLRALDVFVLASQTENFGTALLEAMAMARPCLGTNSGGTPEILDLGNAGILFEYGNLDDLYSKLHKILKDANLRNDFGLKARQRIISNYTLTNTINQLIKSYNQIVE